MGVAEQVDGGSAGSWGESRPSAVHLSLRGDIEGLRAFAVLLVVAFHAGVSGLSGGFVGVDVFFVISGYLITRLLRAEISRTGTIRLPAFYARRIRRLLPAAGFVLVVSLPLAAMVLSPIQMIGTAVSAQAAAAYVSNVHFLRLASDYFSGDVTSNPMLHTWSLSVEEQFYLAWPLVLLVFARAGSHRRLAWALTAIGLVSFAASCRYTSTNESLAFYGTPLRAWEFACGGLASMFVPASGEAPSPAARVWYAAGGWLGVALIVVAAGVYSATTEFPGAAALVPVAGASLLLIAGAPRSAPPVGSAGRVLSAPGMRWIGRRSYSWYLWHWPILVLGTASHVAVNLPARLGLAAIALLLADVTYRFIEQPARAASFDPANRRGRPWRAIQLGIAGTVAVIACAEGVRRWAITASNSPGQRAYTAAASDIAAPYQDGCVNATRDDRVHVCVYGVPSSPTRVALFGDSHAVQWFPALDEIARARGWTLLVISKSRCATADVPVYEAGSRHRSLACERWRRAAMDTIERRHPAFVVLSNALVYVRGPRLDPEVPAVSVGRWEGGIARTLGGFQERGIATIVIRDTPLLAANVPLCLARSGWLGHATCATDRARALNGDVAGAERRAVATMSDSREIDLSDALCGRRICPPMVNGIVAYSDNEHLTATMARSLAPALEQALVGPAATATGDMETLNEPRRTR